MNDFISSYVIRIMSSEKAPGKKSYRIKLSHVQSGEEMYLHSFEELKTYLEESVTLDKGAKEFQ
ncbi:hypothetical protein J2S74_004352 [Evansella vedderi]|uniref:Uncharacterized protein n=1 Tax=Evansella vedderi TaxID=38282 RepID=A0ABU0A089_9BACI|nr:hypothetical protein [Evansella vedderi]MDQ0256907.1 hypothetical protein [Evansella vedderi]